MSLSSVVDEVNQALRPWFGDRALGVQSLGEGHIHSTWLVSVPTADASDGLATPGAAPATEQRYVLQNINQSVFVEPDVVMANLLELVRRMTNTDQTPLGYLLPEPVVAPSGDWLVRTGLQQRFAGADVPGVWRLTRFVERSRTLQLLDSIAQAEAAGRAFGEFQHWLGAQQRFVVAEVIPGFHQLPLYLQALQQAVLELRRAGRPLAIAEQAMLDGVNARDYSAAAIDGHAATALIHGDCKVNNLLFAADTDRVVAILDLDTLMHGPWWLDFGDLVRSATCTEAFEFNAEYYPALATGFFSGAQLTDARLEDAQRAPAYMTYMLCVRFLTDHLRGDRYFTVAQRGDNLERAQQQYRLLETLESAETVQFMRGVLAELL